MINYFASKLGGTVNPSYAEEMMTANAAQTARTRTKAMPVKKTPLTRRR